MIISFAENYKKKIDIKKKGIIKKTINFDTPHTYSEGKIQLYRNDYQPQNLWGR